MFDTVKECLREKGLDVRQARRRCRIGVNGGVCEGKCMGHSLGDEPQSLMRCHSCRLPQLYEAFGWKSDYGPANDLKGLKGKIYFFYLLP